MQGGFKKSGARDLTQACIRVLTAPFFAIGRRKEQRQTKGRATKTQIEAAHATKVSKNKEQMPTGTIELATHDAQADAEGHKSYCSLTQNPRTGQSLVPGAGVAVVTTCLPNSVNLIKITESSS